ncbi:hypothetical protein J437_LFUL013389 [Ladona fulva]|uniref:Uncharacterized protein n=1 Tax=Ladona fulva TaxID=123851 RepID=A0A8K0KI10_LADFU|nr:hypothetical protein J437_LFUL013389 [Ladona fulva]
MEIVSQMGSSSFDFKAKVDAIAGLKARFSNKRDTNLSRIVIGNETRVHHCMPKSKQAIKG